MPVYLELFHGRRTLTEELADWGTEGPIVGPFRYVHTTYATDIKIETADGACDELHLVGEETPDLLCYDGVFYGDWSVFGAEVLENNPALLKRVQPFDSAKAETPLPTGQPGSNGVRHETEARI